MKNKITQTSEVERRLEPNNHYRVYLHKLAESNRFGSAFVDSESVSKRFIFAFKMAERKERLDKLSDLTIRQKNVARFGLDIRDYDKDEFYHNISEAMSYSSGKAVDLFGDILNKIRRRTLTEGEYCKYADVTPECIVLRARMEFEAEPRMVGGK